LAHRPLPCILDAAHPWKDCPSVFTHNIYRNIRTRVIVVRDGKMLLFPAVSDGTGRDPYRCLPGGGLHPNESLYECGEREVLEETGLRVRVTGLAFLRECVVPKCVSVEEMKGTLGVWEAAARAVGYEEAMDLGARAAAEQAYALEAYLWGELRKGESGKPRPDDIFGTRAEWVPLGQVPNEPLFPTELKALARDLAEGRVAVGVPLFASAPTSPWNEGDRVHP
jgi:8-oxo-dGTP pyrophosphatase MutT (NUDIX family)